MTAEQKTIVGSTSAPYAVGRRRTLRELTCMASSNVPVLVLLLVSIGSVLHVDARTQMSTMRPAALLVNIQGLDSIMACKVSFAIDNWVALFRQTSSSRMTASTSIRPPFHE